MKRQLKRFFYVLWISVIPIQMAMPQDRLTKDNYTGDWEEPASWNPPWPVPLSDISNADVTIYGYITANSSLSLSGFGDLIIEDTLVIRGNLTINDDCNVLVKDNGILIVRGNVTISNKTNVTANGYLIITGDFHKLISIDQGSFTSNDIPAKVFIGGDVTPPGLKDNKPNHTALNCTSPLSPYQNSGCSYGNMDDLINDPVYAFFLSTCVNVTVTSNSPVCEGSELNLSGGPDGMTAYFWTGPDGFTSDLQNPIVSDFATTAMQGLYTLTVTHPSGCTNSATNYVLVKQLPVVNISGSNSMCLGDLIWLRATPEGGIFTVLDGPGIIFGNSLSAIETGTIIIEYTYHGLCSNSATKSINVYEKPISNAGPDQELTFIFETQMDAELLPGETGIWSVISGTGLFDDIHSPVSRVSNLSVGESIFHWKVLNENCEDVDDVKIIVNNLFVPSVITPNGDGKNDFFRVDEYAGRIELIIFNHWGNEEFRSSDYKNDWDGRNQSGAKLPSDTYFYILKFENGKVKKGSVLIKR
jgi:gliding motility-associated-like protein